MQRRNLILLGLAIVIGLVAVVLANSYFSGVEERQAAVAEQQKLARIVVATQPLDFGEPLTPQNLKLQNWPVQSVPQGAFVSIPEALKDNRVAIRPLVPGEPVLRSKVSGTDGRATLANLLPDGFRAVSIPVNNVNNVSGFVLPGTTVDVLLVRQIEGEGASSQDQRADLLLENVQVLAVDQLANDKEGTPQVSRTVTLAVTPRDAQRIAVANKMGTLQLALRKVESAARPESNQVASTVTSRELGIPRIVIPGSRNSGGGNPPPPTRSAPTLASVSQPSLSARSLAPVYRGPSMTVVRGTEPTDYQVGSLGGYSR